MSRVWKITVDDYKAARLGKGIPTRTTDRDTRVGVARGGLRGRGSLRGGLRGRGSLRGRPFVRGGAGFRTGQFGRAGQFGSNPIKERAAKLK